MRLDFEYLLLWVRFRVMCWMFSVRLTSVFSVVVPIGCIELTSQSNGPEARYQYEGMLPSRVSSEPRLYNNCQTWLFPNRTMIQSFRVLSLSSWLIVSTCLNHFSELRSTILVKTARSNCSHNFASICTAYCYQAHWVGQGWNFCLVLPGCPWCRPQWTAQWSQPG